MNETNHKFKLDRVAIAYIILVITAALAFSLAASLIIYQNHKIDEARVDQCVTGRTLIQTLLLDSVDSTVKQWNADPERVIEHFRVLTIKQFTDLGINADTETARAQIDRAIIKFEHNMSLADTDGCKLVT